MPTNRIIRLLDRKPDTAWILINGRWHCCGHTLECDPPSVCTELYNCECDACSNCELPEIDLDKLCEGSDSLEPLDRERNCDDESR